MSEDRVISEQRLGGPRTASGPADRVAADGTLLIRDVTVARAGRPVVSDVSLDVPPGEITALLGPNGAGKSSLVLAIGGVLRPVRGTISLGDRNLTRMRSEAIRRAGVAIVPEGRRLLPALSVEDNLGVATYTMRRDEARAARERALDLFPELRKRLRAPARLLSGGEQQMVVLAQALVSAPRVIVIDELSLGLAPVVVSRLIPTLRTIVQSGIGVLLIEQFATVALGLANRAYIMNGGRIEFSGDAAQLRDQPELLHFAYLLRGGGPSVSVTSIDHVLVLSDDIDAARDFYCAVLGLAAGERPPLEFDGHWLYAAGAPRVHIADRAQYTAHARSIGLPPSPQGEALAIDHIAFVAGDYGDAVARLERAGVPAVHNAVPGAGLRQLFFAGPEGVRIEVNVVEGERKEEQCAPR